MSSYTLRKALDVIKSHNLRDDPDATGRLYRLRNVPNSDIEALDAFWQKRNELLGETQQLDTHERQILERYAGMASGVLFSREKQAEREKQQAAEQKQREQEQEAAAKVAKAQFYAELKAGYTGPAEDFDAVAGRMWREHLYQESQQAMQRTRQLARQNMIGIDF